MGVITLAIGPNSEIVRGVHRMIEVIRDIPRPEEVFQGGLEGKTLVLSNEMDKLRYFLVFGRAEEVEEVRIVLKNTAGEDNVSVVEGVRFSRSWAHAVNHYVGRNDRLTHVVLVFRSGFVIFRRSGGETMNDVLHSAAYAS